MISFNIAEQSCFLLFLEGIFQQSTDFVSLFVNYTKKKESKK